MIRNVTPQPDKLQGTKIKNFIRVGALLLLLLTMMGRWLIDTHPATQETCLPPVVWLGDGYCACISTFVESFKTIIADQSFLWLLWVLPLFPFLSTILLVLGKERRSLWIFHLIAWGLTSVFALFFFFLIMWISHFILIMWGAGLGGLLAVAMLVGEIWVEKRFPAR